MITPQPKRLHYNFHEFIESGLNDAKSPFLTDRAQHVAQNLPLKLGLLASLLLVAAFTLSFYPSQEPLSLLLYTFVYFITGTPALIKAAEDLAELEINIDTLMTLAAFGSAAMGSPFEGALLLVLFEMSRSIEESVTQKAKSTLSGLRQLAPEKAWVKTSTGHWRQKSIHDIRVGETILVKAGEVVPLDGTVTEGSSSVTLAHLTGESVPFSKTVNDTVSAGSQNLEGFLVLEVTTTSSNSTLTQIVGLVTEAQEAKPQLQRWFDKVADPYAKSIITLSALIAFSLPFLISIPYLGNGGSVYRALSFLIAASPCALIIAMPIAYLSSISSCARRGILLKGGTILDALADCDTFCFDKTGTLTTGSLEVVEAKTWTGHDFSEPASNEDLQAAFCLEQKSSHPIALAIYRYGEKQGFEKQALKSFRQVPGMGVEGEFLGKMTYVGRLTYIKEQLDFPLKAVEEALSLQVKKGLSNALMCRGGRLTLITFQDKLRKNIQKTLQNLKQQGLALTMLTGDHEEAAQRVAKNLSLDHVYASLKPEDKLTLIDKLSQDKHIVMIGDGINDAPALAKAQVGIAMGGIGSYMAQQAADIVLLHDNVQCLDWLNEKAKHTQRVVKQNLSLAGIAIVLATSAALAGWIPLWAAVLAHEGGTIVVGLNGLRLTRS